MTDSSPDIAWTPFRESLELAAEASRLAADPIVRQANALARQLTPDVNRLLRLHAPLGVATHPALPASQPSGPSPTERKPPKRDNGLSNFTTWDALITAVRKVLSDPRRRNTKLTFACIAGELGLTRKGLWGTLKRFEKTWTDDLQPLLRQEYPTLFCRARTR